jgi:queuine tRNA-ribosyltransferase
MFEFKITGKLLGRGRKGELKTPHGTVQTPVFMPVGTNAAVKAVPFPQVEQLGAQIVLANNYHLFLRPGSNTVAKLGGIHQFMAWDKPVLTDSGGFQVWSLAQNQTGRVKLSEQGVTFTSHLDGTAKFLSPEIATRSQIDIGADIIMAFDQCTPDLASQTEAEAALKLTDSWLLRSANTWTDEADPKKQAMFGIIQGGLHRDLRRKAATTVLGLDLPGIAIGGETIGYNMEGTETVLGWLSDLLPENKPRYTMGVGLNPSDLLRVISLGVDMFDCVAPTRLARNGALYTGKVVIEDNQWKFVSDSKNERINIGSTKYREDDRPIDADCDCQTCQQHSRAYLHHLYKAKELGYFNLASVHNLRLMINTVNHAIELAEAVNE